MLSVSLTIASAMLSEIFSMRLTITFVVFFSIVHYYIYCETTLQIRQLRTV